MGQTIILESIKLESLTLTRREDSVRVGARFVYLDDTGEEIVIGDTPARDYVRKELPPNSPYLTDIVSFVNNTVIPYIKEQKGL